MIFASPHRARFAALPAVALVAGGVGLGVSGWLGAARAAYLWGMVLATLGLCLLVFVTLPMLRRWVRAALCVVLTAAVVGFGLWVPRSLLDAEFDGENVRWSIPSREVADDMYYDHEFVVAVFGDTVVLANRVAARMVSLADGHELGALPADRDDRFSVAGDRLLVLDRSSAMLYDRVGKPVWPAPVKAERGVAADDGVTVVEDDGVASAIADDGSVRWTRQVDAERAHVSRFPNVSALPADNVDQGPPVLPPVAALPVSGTAWEFVDGAGKSVGRANGEYAGSVGDTPVTSTRAGDGCDVWFGGDRHEVDSTYGKPWAQGDVLFFQNGADAWALAGGQRTRLADVALSPNDKDRRLAVSDKGMAWRDGSLIRGYPGVGYGNGWQFVAETEYATPYVGNGAVAVVTALRRTTPLDPRPGVSPDSNDHDVRITVHDGQTGRVTGSIRAHEVGSVHPVGPGRALLAIDGKILLIG